jgi:hypothetical protein
MTIDINNKRDSIIFATIMTVFVASIIIVIILGIWGITVHSSQQFDTEDITPSIISEWECFKGHKRVPGAEYAFDYNHDVKAGSMEIQYNIPYEFPICITEDFVDMNFGITVWSYGGYHPDDFAGSYMTLYQPKSKKGGLIDITWDDGVAAEGRPCSTMMYTAFFDIVGGGPIILESNHLPSVITDNADYSYLLEPEPTPDLGKWVDVSVFSSWEGCPDPNQKFKLILAHYYMF